MMRAPYHYYKQHIQERQEQGLYRSLTSRPPCAKLQLDFSTNDYLDFSQSPDLLSWAYQAGKDYGVGATGSRMLSGNIPFFEEFEALIAHDKGTEAALIFNSGFQANISVLSSLLDERVLRCRANVFFDRLNHASLYQAVTLSGAQMIRYHHNDMEHLKKVLERHHDPDVPAFIVTETLFGMDGDVAPLEEIVALAAQFNACLYIDDAHGTGIGGPLGYGFSTKITFADVPHVIMGTFSKALGVCGAYIACSGTVKNYLLNHTPGMIYSTALSPMLVAAAMKGWTMIKEKGEQRKELWSKASYLRTRLKDLGWDVELGSSPIIPLKVGEACQALALQEKLAAQGIRVSAVRPPTVPLGSSRIRIALRVSHQQKDLDRLIQALSS